jgi:hypothetical protein
LTFWNAIFGGLKVFRVLIDADGLLIIAVVVLGAKVVGVTVTTRRVVVGVGAVEDSNELDS